MVEADATTLILHPFEQSTWSIARILCPTSDVTALLQALSPGGVSYYPDQPEDGRARSLLLLDRHFPGWMDVVRRFASDPASLHIVPHESYDFSWRLPSEPMPIGANLRIASRSCEARGPDLIRVDPGLAFGNFRHPTTSMCAAAVMEVARPGSSLLDVGCGTGILFLIASRLGVKRLAATDIAPYARYVAARNAALNDVQIAITHDLPDARFDVVVANVWSRAFHALGAPICARLADGGTAIVSGFGSHEADAVAACFPELRFEKREQSSWCALVGVRA
ncbi:MAG: 50S ribosomal protein L11 methyltransferase [Labilithrix sp.]|nr:50S ribosomal protein L11 methyltransferase [Labilithrix sp.]MCW5811207.1 50S ribosomal protein L11 methyltransferase [Labilithrix sp.]